MRPFSILSLIIAVLTALSGLVTLCPEGEGNGFSVHFIMETCDTHDCNPTAGHHSCRSDDCAHGICGDVDIGANYHPVQQFQYESIPLPSRFVIEDYPGREIRTPGQFAERPAGIVSTQRSSILRS